MITNHSVQDCKQELKSFSLKVTPARLGVLKLLEKTDKPLDVASIASYLSANNIIVDNATVFRIINLFTRLGLTRQIHLNEDKFRYEIASAYDHHHLICENCHQIEDIQCSVKNIDKEIKRKKGFVVNTHSLEFFGLCAKCQKRQ